MGNRDMPSETQVYVVHHLPKDLSMSTCVLNAIEVNIIMYHLVDDSILHFIFRQVKAGVDTETEVVEFQLTEQFPSFLIYKHAKEGLGVAKLDGKNREFIIKNKMIKLPKLILNVFYCGFHYKKVDALFTGKGTFLLCYCQTKTYIRIIACCAI